MNSACPHKGSVVTPLREMRVRGEFRAVLAEAARLREQDLTEVQLMVVEVNEQIANLELGNIGFEGFRAQFEDLMDRIRRSVDGQKKDIFLSETLLLLICYADWAGEAVLRDSLTDGFFDEINPRCLHAMNEFLVLKGLLATRQGKLRLALAYFTQGMTLLLSGNDPCALEVAARYVARAYTTLGMHDDARRVLYERGLPVDDESMALLLIVPVV